MLRDKNLEHFWLESIGTICHHILIVYQWRTEKPQLKIWRRPCPKYATLSAVLITGTCVKIESAGAKTAM